MATAPITILLVDDDRNYHVLIRNLLMRSRLDFELRWVGTFADGLEAILDPAIDISLVDYRLGDRTGIEILRHALQHGIRSPMILLTGYSDHEIDLEAMAAGAADYLYKGKLDDRILERTIRYALERKRMSDDLRQSEERLRTVVTGAPVILCSVDRNGIVVLFEGRGIEALNIDAAEVVGRPVEDFRLYDPKLVGNIGRALAGESVTDTIRFRGLVFECRFSPSLNPAGAIIGMVGVATDITERVRHEEALRRSRLELKDERDFISSVLDTVGSLVLVFDSELKIVQFNRACEELSGYGFQEVVGRNVLDFLIPPEEIESLANAFSRLEVGEVPRTRENEWLTKSGERKLILWTNSALYNDEGAVAYGIGTGIDITAQRAAEKALRDSEERYRHIVETANEGIWLVAPDATITFANARTAEMLGYPIQEIVGRSVYDFQDGEWAAIGRVHHSRRRHGVQEQYDFQFVRQDGTRVWVIISASPAFDANGVFVGSLAMITDITERKNAENALQEAHDKLEMRVAERTAEIVEMMARLEQAHLNQKRFVADASHDLRTPLTVLRAELDQLLHNASHDPRTRGSLVRIANESKRLEHLASDLLLLATIDAHQSVVLANRVWLDGLLLDSVAQLTTIAVEKDITWDVQIDDSVEIICDVATLERGLTNVLENSIKYSAGPGRVEVRLHRDGGTAVITVRDQGIGIPPNDLPRVFDRFYRGDLSRGTPGTGLGLPIVKAVVEAHRGEIRLESEVGVGTTVTLLLPVIEA